MKPKYRFDLRRFLIGAGFLVVGAILAYWQYQRWFNPEVTGEFAIRKASMMGIILTFFLILSGIYLIFLGFKGTAETVVIFLPKEKWDDLKKAIQTLERKDFEKLLEAEAPSSPQNEYAALTIELFENQPGLATVQGFKQILNSTGGYYETKNQTKTYPVEGPVVDVLLKIKSQYESKISS